jgi:hypothetical protein
MRSTSALHPCAAAKRIIISSRRAPTLASGRNEYDTSRRRRAAPDGDVSKKGFGA